MAYHWIAVTARTGEVVATLPDLAVDRIEARLCDYATTTATLPVPEQDPAWVRATAPYATCLVLLDDSRDPSDPDPVWGGIVTQRTRTGEDTVELSLTTYEAYLDRRFVTDIDYQGAEQCALAADLVTRCVLDGSTPLLVEHHPGVTTRTCSWTDVSDTTVLEVLTDLAELEDGPEFTIGWRRVHDGTADRVRYVPVLTVADRIGTPTAPGLAPAVVWQLPGHLVDVQLVESWANGSGATRVLATGSSSGDAPRPQSPVLTIDDPDRPTVEHRWSPGGQDVTVAELTGYATAALTGLRDGAQSLALTLSAAVDPVTGTAPPLVGRDWQLGDDLGFQVGGTDPDGTETVPAFPGGLQGAARCVGWQLDLTAPATLTPVLAGTRPFVQVEEIR